MKNADARKLKWADKISALVDQLQAKKIKHKCPDISKIPSKNISGVISELTRLLKNG